MIQNPQPPSLQGVIASLLWLSAHPDRRICLHHEMQMLAQMRYLADYPDDDVEPLLRSVAHQLAEELDIHVREQIAEREEDAPAHGFVGHGAWVN
jgi:hypothetical protein